MGIVERLKVLMAKGASAALAPAPDPRVTHLTTHQKQRALLNQVIKATQEVTAAKERLKATADDVRAKLPAMEEQARSELRLGHEAAARVALQRRQVVASELETLERQLAGVEKEEAALTIIEQRLSGQIEAFTARQEVIRARYSAAEAQVRINEAMTGVSQDFADLTAALHRAEQTTEAMQARATAIDRLVEEGDLESIAFAPVPDAAGDDDVERRLNALKELG
jgi:phage shock protein A